MTWLFSVVLCSALLVSNAYAAASDRERDGGPRIRPQDARSTQLLRDGMARVASGGQRDLRLPITHISAA